MTTFTPTARSTQPRADRCESCAAPVPHLPQPYGLGRPAILCPTCAARVSLENAAADHLHALIYPTVLAWARHWKGAGVGAGALGSLLALEGHFWNPDGALYRDCDEAEAAAAAVIDEAIAGR
ncbi:hypothetical protein [Deinococcus marmoris]|uniref:Uncharacterized protein n=1 Tax=Deinococcus marmoris TaxID=249408 RepID=A0A1U7NTY3_9DEIO|nr:hypothetical protein [Deinococcus marmoris]OLV16365.1 hypothetical protein BOO71_0012226 [Deinococcus marmoris]